MELKIYKEKKIKEDNAVRLSLRKLGSTIELVAVDEWGKRLTKGSILGIRKDGTLSRYFSMRVPGLKTDVKGRIVLQD